MLLGKTRQAPWTVGQRKKEGAAGCLQPSSRDVAGEGASQADRQSSAVKCSGKKTWIRRPTQATFLWQQQSVTYDDIQSLCVFKTDDPKSTSELLWAEGNRAFTLCCANSSSHPGSSQQHLFWRTSTLFRVNRVKGGSTVNLGLVWFVNEKNWQSMWFLPFCIWHFWDSFFFYTINLLAWNIRCHCDRKHTQESVH